MARTDDTEPLIEQLTQLQARASAQPALAQRLQELRAWQAARLARTYEDVRRDPQLAQAAEFFLNDVYGPQDFARRNLELTRAWNYFKRTLPATVLTVLAQAIELETLTSELDHAMVTQLPPGPIDGESYAVAYRAVGRADARAHQIDLIEGIGEVLSRVVRRRWIAIALRAAHAPAHAAGFGVLQDFLERGFAGFRQMQDPERLLRIIQEREGALMQALFGHQAVLDTSNHGEALT
jgi:hypothetical protein